MNSRDMVIGFGAHEKNPDQLKHLVVFEQGRLSHRSVLQVGQSVPVPPGYLRSWVDRRNNLDFATYDRMRVVTTELRRLLARGRNIQLRLGPKVSLSSSDLHKALRMIPNLKRKDGPTAKSPKTPHLLVSNHQFLVFQAATW